MPPLPGIFALLVGVAGWYYLFYSKAARNLGGIEPPAANRRRDRLRRINGGVMFCFAGFFYAGCYAFAELTSHVVLFLVVWGVAIVLLFVMVVLVFADVRLTAKLKRRQ